MKNYFVLFSLLLLLACNSDDVLVETVIISDSDMNIKVEETKNNIVIRIESLEDFTDNRNGEFPNTDFCTIIFDANYNTQKDADIDYGIGSPTADYDICSFYLLDNEATSPCGGYETSAVFDSEFIASGLEETPHNIWTVTIPKDEFAENKVEFVVKVFQEGIYTDYPEQRELNDASFLLGNTYSFEW